MKKKVFSKLLMVALVATVGAFTSCKDYDDDINDLRSKLDGLNTSLTATVNEKIKTVETTINDLKSQLATVEADYAAADAALQTTLDGVKSQGELNKQAIEGLQGTVVTLGQTDASLRDAITALETGLNEAKTNLNDALTGVKGDVKSNSDKIAALTLADQTLENKITEANTKIATAQSTADAAKEKAAEVANGLKDANGEISKLAEQITNNMNSLDVTLSNVNLDNRIKTNASEITKLWKEVNENLAKKTALEQAIQDLNRTNLRIDTALTAAKAYADAQDTKVKDELNKKINAFRVSHDSLAYAVRWITEHTIPTLIEDIKNHYVPDVVDSVFDAKLYKVLEDYMTSDRIDSLVKSETGKNLTLIKLLEAKVKEDSTALAAYTDAQVVLAASMLSADYKAKEGDEETSAYQLAEAIKAADKVLSDDIDLLSQALADEKDASKAGSLASLIAEMKDASKAGSLASLIAEMKDSEKAGTLAYLIAEMKDANKEGSLAQKIQTVEEFFAPAADGGNLSIDNLVGKIQGTALETLVTNISNTTIFVNSLEEATNALMGSATTMITSINLFANQHDAQNDGVFASWLGGFDHTLTFTYTIEKENVFPADANITDKQFTFEEGMYRSYADSILVRVSPTNADLTAAWKAGNIALLNSQGADVVAKEIIEVDSVARFNRLLTATRSAAAGNETGLWVIYFKMNDRKIGTDFEDAATAKVNGQTQKVLYSIGVKNTDTQEGEKERYVVSEYDLDLSTAPAYPAWDFYVNGKSVAKIHNRYIETDKENVVSDDSTGLDKKTFRNEYTWIGYAPYEAPYAMLEAYASLLANENNEAAQKYVGMVPATKMILEEEDPENFNTVDRLNHSQGSTSNGVDNRHKYEILPVTVGEPISIDFPEWFQFDASSDAYYNNMFPTPIKGFYVTLDHDFALESIPSEINAWTGYEYENVGVFKKDADTGETTITKATLFDGNHGTITIKKLNNVSGDVIGFRVFAVNLDGTLTDPDGRAFYVKVGQEFDNELTFKVVAETYDESGNIQDGTPNPILAQNNLFKADKTGTVDPFFNVDKDGGYTYDITWGENNPQIQMGGQLYTPAAGNYGVLGSDQYESYNVIEELFKFYNTKEEVAAYGDAEANWKGMDIKKSGKNVPTYETNNMAVQILKANSLIDGETYNLVLTIKKGTGSGAYNVVSKTLIHVIKTVPTALPNAFKVKETLDVFAKDMKFYLRPIADTQTWDLTWFDSRAEDFGVSALAPSEAVSGGSYYIPWFVNSSGDMNNDRSRTTRAYYDAYYNYRWATDVRPYNFEEIFAGLIDANNNFDQNYTFVFEGCGDLRKDNVAGDAISTYRMYDPSWIDYTGVNAAGTATKDMHPGYYLPLVYYQVIDKYNDINKDKYVAVKAGYTYHNVSLTLDKEGKIKKDENGYPVYDKVITPSYFKANGEPTAKKEEAGFKATFYCAVHEKFHGQAGRYKVADFKEFTGSNDGQVGDGTADTERTYEFKTGEYIPYAYGFTVTLDSIGVNWTSNLAALTSTDPLAKAAAYFRTNFDKTKGGFTSSYTTKWKNGAAVTTDVLASDGISYYNDSLYAKENALNGNVLYSKCNNDEEAKWLKLADLSDVAVDFNNSTIEQLKANGTKDKDIPLTAATLAEYFIVTSNGNTVTFKPKTIAIDPTKIGQMSIKVKATAKLIHQWGHVNSYDFTSGAILIGKPHSAENTARQSRR